MKKQKLIFIICSLALTLVACEGKGGNAPEPETDDTVNISDSEEDDMPGMADPHAAEYVGLWSCGDYNIWISAEDQGIKAKVEYKQDGYNYTTWNFACLYEEETSSFTDPGYGVKTISSYDEDGELTSDEIVSDKEGCRLTIDKKGFLTWQNFNEETATDLKFEKKSDSAYSMWEETDEAALLKQFPEGLFRKPEGAVLKRCEILDVMQPNEDVSPLVEMVFELDGRDYAARMQQGSDVEWNISGTYYFWAVEKDVKLPGWGDGVKAKYYNTVEADSAEALLIWHDQSTSSQYSLYYSSPDGNLDDIDLIKVAEEMHR